MTYNHDLPPEPQFPPDPPPTDVEQLAATLRDAFLGDPALTVWEEGTPEVKTRWRRVAEAALTVRAAPKVADHSAHPDPAVRELVELLAAHFVMWHDLEGNGPSGEWRCACGAKFGFSTTAIHHQAAALLAAFDVRRKPSLPLTPQADSESTPAGPEPCPVDPLNDSGWACSDRTRCPLPPCTPRGRS